MYKIQLQELCQKRQWGLPRYESSKVGSDHAPRFAAVVFANGLEFRSDEGDSEFFRSSKEAQNDAARVAFLHFSASQPPLASAAPPSGKVTSNSRTMFDSDSGTEVVYKNLLQCFAQRKNITLPVYECVREGPSHLPSFKASVTIDGQIFETTGFSHTIKEAEQAAARIAFETLAHGALDNDITPPFKVLLQKFCSKQGLDLPIYETSSTGSSHISNVKVDGETFHGKPAKSKKLAELSAAELGWAALKERKERTGYSFDSHISEVREALERSTLCSTTVITNDISENNEVIVDQFRTMQLVPDDTGVKLTGRSSTDKMDDEIDLFEQACRPMTELNSSQNLASTGQRNFSDVERVLDSSLDKLEDKNSLPLQYNFSDSFNKILVFSRASSVQPPPGAVKLPIQDDKWMAFQLECPAGTA